MYLYRLDHDVRQWVGFYDPRIKAFANRWFAIEPGQYLGASGYWATTRTDYAWDGCSPKWRLRGGKWIGTPEGPIIPVDEEPRGLPGGVPRTWYAALDHDCICQFREEIAAAWGIPVTEVRDIGDQSFRWILHVDRFLLAEVYYRAVQFFGRYYMSMGTHPKS